MICENCGKEHDGSYGSGRFCSCKCARSFSAKVNREESNNKISQTLLKRRNLCNFKTDFTVRYCMDCGKQLSFKNKSGYCRSCHPKHTNTKEEYIEKQRQTRLKMIENGTHKGWTTRNIKSYAERFWETALDNNHILYEREKKVGKYFLDFVIGKVDLEIDGKQHKCKDRAEHDAIRDQYLTDCGYIVYRIDWNEINSEAGKQTMKLKIDQLLKFLSTV